jgi:O-succinylbenzoate synthase
MEISYHRYRLKLLDAVRGNARSARRILEGFLIRVDGGYGGVQPWPELGDASLEEQWQALRAGGSTPLLERAHYCAAVDGAARREGRSLFEGMAVPRSHATVTGPADFVALRAEGFERVKLKGARDWQPVLRQMEEAVAAGLRLSIDFNGVLDEAVFGAFAKAASALRAWVDFVEDPVPYDPVVWVRLRQATGWCLALDRAPSGKGGGYDLRVLKPALDGMATRPGPVVITSYMDHPLGQAFAAWEAARYAGVVAGAGLLTHRLFEADAFQHNLSARGPEWIGPGGTGLGFDDLLAALPWIPLTENNSPKRGKVWQNPRDSLPGGGPDLADGQIGFATSGSTGLPSVVVHTEESLAVSAQAVNAWLGATAESVWLRVLPEFHVGGYQIHTRAGLSGSRLVVDAERWDAERFARICQEEGVSLTSLVPAQVVDLVRCGQRPAEGLRAVVVGGGDLAEDILTQARQLGWPLLPSYGNSEAGSQVATASLFRTTSGTEETGGRGLEVLPHWEVRVRQDPGARPAGAGEGVLEVRGPALACGRFVWCHDRWDWHTLADRDGWWRTSDRVILSGRRLRFAGRVDRVVKILGELVSLESVEQGLAEAGLAPGRFAVVAVPELRQGMRLVLVVEESNSNHDDKVKGPGCMPVEVGCFPDNRSGCGAAVDAAVAAYGKKAAPFARISQVVGVARLPRAPLGKIRYAEVAALIPPSAPE